MHQSAGAGEAEKKGRRRRVSRPRLLQPKLPGGRRGAGGVEVPWGWVNQAPPREEKREKKKKKKKKKKKPREEERV